MRIRSFFNKPIIIKQNHKGKGFEERRVRDANEAREIVKNRTTVLFAELLKENGIEEFIEKTEKMIYEYAQKGVTSCYNYWYYNEDGKYDNCKEIIDYGVKVISEYFKKKGFDVDTTLCFPLYRIRFDFDWK